MENPSGPVTEFRALDTIFFNAAMSQLTAERVSGRVGSSMLTGTVTLETRPKFLLNMLENTLTVAMSFRLPS